jgi:Reverse transcriptase (RNA-dependent DNA polymerase)
MSKDVAKPIAIASLELRPLKDNDLTQTISQWRTAALHHIGLKHGVVVSSMKNGFKPRSILTRPIEPLKPTADILTELQNEWLASNTASTTLPPSLLVFLREYNADKTVYDSLLKSYKDEEDLVKAFDILNVEAFSETRATISDSTIRRIEDTQAGKLVALNNDAIGLFLIACVPLVASNATVLQEAINYCALQVTTCKQTSAESARDFFSKLEERIADLLAICPSYQLLDFQKMDVVKNGLNASWKVWLTARTNAGTMPTTFADLVYQIQIADDVRLFSLKADVKGGDHIADNAVHDTKTDSKKKRVVLSKDKWCKFHIKIGQESKAKSHTTAECTMKKAFEDSGAKASSGKHSNDHNSSKNRSSGKDRANKTTSKSRRGDPPPLVDRHTALATEVNSDSELSDSADDEDTVCCTDQETFFGLPDTINCTDCVTTIDTEVNASISSGGSIYFDNCATGCIIKDRELLENITTSGMSTRVGGSVPGALTAHEHGELGPFGKVPLHQSFTKNILCQSRVESCGWSVVTEKQDPHKPHVTTCYRLEKDDVKLRFMRTEDGIYSLPISSFISSFPDLYSSVNNIAMTSVPTRLTLTTAQRHRADMYQEDHRGCLLHISPTKTKLLLNSGSSQGFPFTAKDVENAIYLYGKCPTCIEIKGTRPHATGAYSNHPSYPGENLAADLIFFGPLALLLTSDRLLQFLTLGRLKGKTTVSLVKSISDVVDIYSGLGHKVKSISCDMEPGIMAHRHQLMTEFGITIVAQPPAGHEKKAERSARTVKEHVHCVLKGLASRGIRLSPKFIFNVAADVIKLLNRVPNSSTAPSTPSAMLKGEILDYSKLQKTKIGDIGYFFKPYNEKSKEPERRELGLVVGHTSEYHPIVVRLPSGGREVVRDKRFVRVPDNQVNIKAVNDLLSVEDNNDYDNIMEVLQAELQADNNGQLVSTSPFAQRNFVVPPAIIDPADPTPSPGEPQDLGVQDLGVSIQQATRSPSRPAMDTSPILPPVLPPRVSRELRQIADWNSPPQAKLAPQPDRVLIPPTPVVQSARNDRPRRESAIKPIGFYKDTPIKANIHLTDQVALIDINYDETFTVNASHLNHSATCAKYGMEAHAKAGIDEIINVVGSGSCKPIKAKDVAKLQQVGSLNPLPSFMFFKGKEIIAGEKTLAVDGSSDLHSDIPEDEHDWTQVKKKLPPAAIKLKARLVGGGHRQKNVDKSIIVAPTARSITHNMLFNIAAFTGGNIKVADVPAAYLNAAYESANGKATYIRFDKICAALAIKAYPHLLDCLLKDGTMICVVDKALYGLVESAWLWYRELSGFLLSIGYSHTADLGAFEKRSNAKVYHIVTLHVDDMNAVSSNNKGGEELDHSFFEKLNAKYPGIKIQQGPVYKHLGFNITLDRKNRTVTKDQNDYTRKILKQNNIVHKEKYPCRSDLCSGEKPDVTPLGPKAHAKYRSCLQQAAYLDRPEIKFVISTLQTCANKPVHTDLADLHHLFGYLNANPDATFTYRPVDLQLRAYADASFAIHKSSRSHYGLVITLGGFNNAAIMTRSGTIKSVMRSSTEPEITAVNEVTSELLFAKDFMESIGFPQDSIPIKEDNTSCITMLQKDPRNFQTKSRHVRVKYDFFREQFKKRHLYLEYCSTHEMTADALTKPLTGKVFHKHTKAFYNA